MKHPLIAAALGIGFTNPDNCFERVPKILELFDKFQMAHLPFELKLLGFDYVIHEDSIETISDIEDKIIHAKITKLAEQLSFKEVHKFNIKDAPYRHRRMINFTARFLRICYTGLLNKIVMHSVVLPNKSGFVLGEVSKKIIRKFTSNDIKMLILNWMVKCFGPQLKRPDRNIRHAKLYPIDENVLSKRLTKGVLCFYRSQ